MISVEMHIESLQANEKRLQHFIDSEGLGGNYLGFDRFYDNNEALLLSTNPELMLNRINQGLPLKCLLIQYHHFYMLHNIFY